METILTAEQRTARAKLAAETRWGKRIDWELSTLDECKDKLADLRAEAEKGGIILQRRMSVERVDKAICYNPDCKTGLKDKDGIQHPAILDIISGRFAGTKCRINPETGLMETAYACSAACWLYLSNNFKHSPGAIKEPVIAPVDNVNNEQAKTLI